MSFSTILCRSGVNKTPSTSKLSYDYERYMHYDTSVSKLESSPIFQSPLPGSQIRSLVLNFLAILANLNSLVNFLHEVRSSESCHQSSSDVCWSGPGEVHGFAEPETVVNWIHPHQLCTQTGLHCSLHDCNQTSVQCSQSPSTGEWNPDFLSIRVLHIGLRSKVQFMIYYQTRGIFAYHI